MEIWVFIFLPLSFFLALKLLFPNFLNIINLTQKRDKKKNKKKKELPPGPYPLPIIGNLLLLTKPLLDSGPLDLEPLLLQLRAKYGPIFTFYAGPRLNIFITNHSMAHEALIQKGIIFADRPPFTEVGDLIRSRRPNIIFARYGPQWRVLRRNLTAEVLHPLRIPSFAHGREWALKLLIKDLISESNSHGGMVRVIEPFRFAMFSLLSLMCFGQKLDERIVRDIESIERRLLLTIYKLNIFTFFPRIGKIVFYKFWNEFSAMCREQEEIFIPLIRARAKASDKNGYVDSLYNLILPEKEGGRKLKEVEMVSLCAEFLDGGTDTTSTTFQWVMANLVKNQDIQAKLWEEIKGIVGEEDRIIREEDLQSMPYLKAVIMEGLRRHPPSHFVIPHGVSEDTTINGYVIPKESTLNFTVGDMGLDGEVWKDPLEFKPERFLGEEGEVVDITGKREIKMMPFGVGRRICPAMDLAILHLEFFVGNLVREFEWRAKDGEEVDMSEKSEFTVVMKNPLEAAIIPRIRRVK
ncbi:cytochrome P450 89A2-like [Tasmannia lanceolata]|uniref:cytochrome P450 89A2-like n=1 Tax=Tasmannia lanceolata TaxID=3420 RepID=UPI004063A15E